MFPSHTSHALNGLQGTLSLFLIERADGNTSVYKHIVTYLCFWDQHEADLLDDSRERYLALSHDAVIVNGFDYLAWNSEAHGYSPLPSTGRLLSDVM